MRIYTSKYYDFQSLGGCFKRNVIAFYVTRPTLEFEKEPVFLPPITEETVTHYLASIISLEDNYIGYNF